MNMVQGVTLEMQIGHLCSYLVVKWDGYLMGAEQYGPMIGSN